VDYQAVSERPHLGNAARRAAPRLFAFENGSLAFRKEMFADRKVYAYRTHNKKKENTK
jgi:hypothetical protein